MFNKIDELYAGNQDAWNELIACIKNGVCLSAYAVSFLVEENDELVVDEGYVDFEDSGRWSISKYYILNIEGEYYRAWREVGLTEMQPSEYEDQVLDRVEEREIKQTVWLTKEEEERIHE